MLFTTYPMDTRSTGSAKPSEPPIPGWPKASVFGEKKQFVLFCAAGWRSALATKTLQDMGVAQVAHIDGGFSAWKQAGAPVAEKAGKAAAKKA